MRRHAGHLAPVAAAALLAGCAGPAHERLVDTPDPFEVSNRSALAMNVAITNVVIKPIGFVYLNVVPSFARDRIAAGIRNAEEPRVFANDMLQGRGNAAGITLGRFLLNSTVGIGGLFDIATQVGLPRQTGDFGQTLYTWGMNSGPYVVIPVLGPATVRDGIGRGVDLGADPTTWTISHYFGSIPTFAIGAADAVGQSREFTELEAGSVDLYARLKSTYLQNRSGELGIPVDEVVAATTRAPARKPLPRR